MILRFLSRIPQEKSNVLEGNVNYKEQMMCNRYACGFLTPHNYVHFELKSLLTQNVDINKKPVGIFQKKFIHRHPESVNLGEMNKIQQ